MGIAIQELINDSVRDDESKEMTNWYVSKLGSCMRGHYLKRAGKEPDEPLEDRVYRIFSVGNQMEDWLVGLIMDHEDVDNAETQVRVEDEDLDISGYADLKIEQGDDERLYEIKTKNSNAFHYMRKKGEGAMRQHEMQLWTYLYLLDIEKGSIIYLSKDDLSILEYVIWRDDESLKDEVLSELELLNEAWEKQDPSILPLPDEDWKADYCSYHEQCIEV